LSLPRKIRKSRRLTTTVVQLSALFWLAAGMHIGHHLFHEHGPAATDGHACCTGESQPNDGDAHAIEAPCPVCLLTANGGASGVCLPALAVPWEANRDVARIAASRPFSSPLPSRKQARAPPEVS